MGYLPLYTAHTLSTWSNRQWEFCAAILSLDLFAQTSYGASLMPVALYGVCENVTIIFFGSRAALYIDSVDRLILQRVLLTIEGLSLSVAALFLLIAFELKQNIYIVWYIFVFVMAVGSIGNLATKTAKTSIEKDWVTALAKESGIDNTLTHLNATMMRIDLVCKIIAPLFIGVFATFFGSKITLLFLVVFNMLCWPVELSLTKRVYESSSALATEKQNRIKETRGYRLSYHFHEYITHPVCLSSLVFTALYMSVVSTCPIGTAYLRWRGLTNAGLALTQAISAGMGVCATMVVSRMVRPQTLNRWGIVFVGLQFSCLVPVIVALLFKSSFTTLIILGGMMTSRFGLYGFDLVATQIMQTWVAPGDVGRINGVQNTLVSVLYMGSYTLGILFPDPRDFFIPALISVSFVALSVILFAIFLIRNPSMPVISQRNNCGERPLLSPTLARHEGDDIEINED